MLSQLNQTKAFAEGWIEALEKHATMADEINQYIKSLKGSAVDLAGMLDKAPYWAAGLSAPYGATAGALIGGPAFALSNYLLEPEEDRNLWGAAGRGMFLGGLAGGATAGGIAGVGSNAILNPVRSSLREWGNS